jgi:hypothetical protein
VIAAAFEFLSCGGVGVVVGHDGWPFIGIVPQKRPLASAKPGGMMG